MWFPPMNLAAIEGRKLWIYAKYRGVLQLTNRDGSPGEIAPIYHAGDQFFCLVHSEEQGMTALEFKEVEFAALPEMETQPERSNNPPPPVVGEDDIERARR